ITNSLERPPRRFSAFSAFMPLGLPHPAAFHWVKINRRACPAPSLPDVRKHVPHSILLLRPAPSCSPPRLELKLSASLPRSPRPRPGRCPPCLGSFFLGFMTA